MNKSRPGYFLCSEKGEPAEPLCKPVIAYDAPAGRGFQPGEQRQRHLCLHRSHHADHPTLVEVMTDPTQFGP